MLRCRPCAGQVRQVNPSSFPGDCLFAAVQHALDDTDTSIQDLRRMVTAPILAGTDRFTEATIEQWVLMYREAALQPAVSDAHAAADSCMEEVQHVRCVARESLPLTEEARQRLADTMLSPRYWGDEFALRVMQEALRVRMLVWQGWDIRSVFEEPDLERNILLRHVGNHWVVCSIDERFLLPNDCFELVGVVSD